LEAPPPASVRRAGRVAAAAREAAAREAAAAERAAEHAAAAAEAGAYPRPLPCSTCAVFVTETTQRTNVYH